MTGNKKIKVMKIITGVSFTILSAPDSQISLRVSRTPLLKPSSESLSSTSSFSSFFSPSFRSSGWMTQVLSMRSSALSKGYGESETLTLKDFDDMTTSIIVCLRNDLSLLPISSLQ